MLPSTNIYDPFSYTDETLFQQYDTNNEIPNSRQEEPASLFPQYFPSPFLDDDDNTLFFHPMPQQQLMVSGGGGLAEIETNIGTSNKATGISIGMTRNNTEQTLSNVHPTRADGAKKPKLPTPPRRTGKTDRHSKIYTAHGLRDRRMRLSLPVARKFFDLQDMLGFDKASKTIDWLFTKSKLAIKELTRNLPQMKNGRRSGGKIVSSTIQCIVASGLEENAINNEGKNGQTSYNPRVRESRKKARARARERTREKVVIRSLEKTEQCFEANPKSIENLGFSTPIEAGEEEYSRNERDFNLQAVAEVEDTYSQSLEHQIAIVDIIEKFFGTSSSSASSSIFDHQNNIAVSSGLESDDSFLGLLEIGTSKIPARMNSIYSKHGSTER